GYGSLPFKTVGVCKYAAENGYRWVFKCDDDTAVYAERLLVEIMENSADYAGYRHAEVASGGPGYILSDRACRIVYTQGNNPGEVWAEDVHVARTLARAGISPVMLPGHHSGMSAH